MSQVHNITHVPAHPPLSEVCLPSLREARDDQGGRCGQERDCYETLILGQVLRRLQTFPPEENPKDELVRAAAEGSQISTNYRANPNTAKYTIVYRTTVASIAAPI